MSYHDQVREFEQRLIRRALRGSKGNMSQAARSLDIHRNTMIARCNALGIDPSAFVQSAKGEAMDRWRAKLKAKGLCLDCGANPSGGEGGTWRLCPECSKKHRDRAREQHLRGRVDRPRKRMPKPIIPRPLDQVFKPVPPKPASVEQKPYVSRIDRMMILSQKITPKSTVNEFELRRQSVC